MTGGEFFFFMMAMDKQPAKEVPKYTLGEYAEALRSIFRPTPPSNPWLKPTKPEPAPVHVDDLGCSHWAPPYTSNGRKD